MKGLRLYAVFVLLALLAVGAWASFHENALEAFLRMAKDPWSVATRLDVTFGSLWFGLWIAYKEGCGRTRFVWLLGLLLLGNIAMAAYLLVQLARLPEEATVEDLLLSSAACKLEA
ncbi:MAG TPA: DUF1475 family protein [Holophagaceae bacterium]|nr:DUF1475 family protein [Holophagaceae bacterium]